MVMQAAPVYDAWESVAQKLGKKPRTIYLTPQGGVFSQSMAVDFAKEEDLVFLCGHYEGIDERVLEDDSDGFCFHRGLCPDRRGAAVHGND